jgi:hypothetical protein
LTDEACRGKSNVGNITIWMLHAVFYKNRIKKNQIKSNTMHCSTGSLTASFALRTWLMKRVRKKSKVGNITIGLLRAALINKDRIKTTTKTRKNTTYFYPTQFLT